MGQSGLATAYYLRRYGIEHLILDDQDRPGGAWLHVWPSMTLFSNAASSNLPGMPMPGYPGFPPADHVIEYLEEYEKRYGLGVERKVEVTDVQYRTAADPAEAAADGIYVVTAADGRQWHARNIVAATGTWSQPFIPAVPGHYEGQQWHSANYPSHNHSKAQPWPSWERRIRQLRLPGTLSPPMGSERSPGTRATNHDGCRTTSTAASYSAAAESA